MAAPDEFTQRIAPSATINVAPIPEDVIRRAMGSDEPDSAFIEDGRVASNGTLDTDYTIKHHYENDYHRFMMGVTAINNGPAIVQLAGKTLLWVCDWTAASLGAHPVIPDSVPERIEKWVLLDECYVPVSVVAVTDGITPLYRISGTYIYGCLVPNAKAIRDVVFPVGAWMKASEFERAIDEKWVKKGYTDSNQQSSQGGGTVSQQGGAAGQYPTRG